MLPSLGLPLVPGDYLFQAIGLGLTTVSTIAGVMIPITKMLAAHRKSINDKIDNLHAILNRRVEELTHTMAAHELDDERRFGEVRETVDTAGDLIRREFGETAQAIREHVRILELKDGERRLEVEHKLQETRHTLYERMDQHAGIAAERCNGLDERVRNLEISPRRRQ